MTEFEDSPPVDPFDAYSTTATPAIARPRRVQATSLANLNLQDELLGQYNIAKNLLHDAEFDEAIPLNQKAQAINSIQGIIAAIVKMQETLHNIQSITAIELALIDTLKEFPEVKEQFLTRYEGRLAAHL